VSPSAAGKGLTTGGRAGPRLASFASGLGMAVFSFLTIRHFFEANYPDSTACIAKRPTPRKSR